MSISTPSDLATDLPPDELIYTPEVVDAFARDLVTRLSAAAGGSPVADEVGEQLTQRFAASLMRELHDEHARNLSRLQDFFTSQSALAQALGVHRDTVRKWEAGSMLRLRATSLERVRTLRAAAEEVAKHMPSDAAVGPWLLCPQPALGGCIPASMISFADPGAYELIVRAASGLTEPASDSATIAGPDSLAASGADPGSSDVGERALAYLHEKLLAHGSLPPAVIYHGPKFEHETALSHAVNEGWFQGKAETLADLVRLRLLSTECYTWAQLPV